MPLRRVLPALAWTIVLLCPFSAEASQPARVRPSIGSISLSVDADGTFIEVTYAGSRHAHAQQIRSAVALDALTVADIDNDGDLDILATRLTTGDLLLWRNGGHGRFTLAHPAQSAGPRSGAGISADVRTGESAQLGDEQYDVAMPRAPDTTEPLRLVALGAMSVVPLRSRVPVASSGRAPPASR